jgi:hypothetical protein
LRVRHLMAGMGGKPPLALEPLVPD